MFDKFIKAALVMLAFRGWVYMYTADRIPDIMYLQQGREIAIKSIPIVTLDREDSVLRQKTVNNGRQQLYTARLMGIFPVKEVSVVQTEQRYVNVSGKPFGIKMFCDGVMVVGFSDVLTGSGYQNPAKTAGLKSGDVITNINGLPVHTNEDVAEIINNYGASPLKIDYLRDEEKHTAILLPTTDKATGEKRSGMWVRDSGAGIGTMTFFDSVTGYFAGLGHGIKDVDTQKELRLLSGEIVPVKITGIVKSRNGSAGQLKGSFTTTKASGKLLYNGQAGVYGKAYTTEKDHMMPVASPATIKTGPAWILTTINGSVPRMYKVEIEKVNLTARDSNKNMVIRITDSRLLTLTGGIVAGMSGSPIIQDGQLAGAVTHVFVNSVDRGYGIFAQNMLQTLDSVAQTSGDLAA